MDSTSNYVNHIMDEITERDVEQVSERLHALGWEEVVYCRDCKFAIINSLGDCKYCERFWDTDGDAQLNLPGDFFCAWGERKVER